MRDELQKIRIQTRKNFRTSTRISALRRFQHFQMAFSYIIIVFVFLLLAENALLLVIGHRANDDRPCPSWGCTANYRVEHVE